MRRLYRRRYTLAVATAMTVTFASGALAATDFEFGDGWTGTWATTVSLGTSVRAEKRNPLLYGPANGHLIGLNNGLGANTIDEGNLNYGKGDRFSTLFKVISEVEVKNGKMGGLLRAKAWYDYTLNNENVAFGNQPNGYNGYSAATDSLTQRRPLSDAGYDRMLKFDGIALLDAYVYNTFQGAGGNDLQVRLGRQVLNWGESLFIQGVNQINPIDVPAFRRPGAELKEVLMPVWMISGSQSLGSAGTLEGFYQFHWEPTPIEAGCGNYWAVAQGTISTNPGLCTNGTPLASATTSTPLSVATGTYVPTLTGVKPKDSGEYGLAYRFGSSKLDTEFGLYGMNIHARTPVVSIKYGAFAPTVSPEAAFWEYPEDLKVYGVSAATNLLGWSVSAELSTTRDFPLQLDGNDMLIAVAGLGPLAQRAAPAVATLATGGGGIFHGFDKINKNQIQVNALKVGNGILGAGQYIFAAEVGYQWNNKQDGVRYNRPFIFGPGPDPTYGGSTCGPLNRQPDGCSSTAGYVTKSSWGYRLKGQLEYSNVFDSGVTVYPSLYWAQDVKGYAADGVFLEDRTTAGLGVRFSYRKKYSLDLNYTTYGNKAKFDPLRDRDYYSANVSVTF